MNNLKINRLFKIIGLIVIFFSASSTYSQQFALNGNAVSLSCDCYRLTTANGNEFGSVWNNNQINLNNSFDFSFDVFLGCNNGGADGLAFVLQPVSTSLGAAGGGLGYAGISPSIVVEVDTYQNTSDPNFDHIAIMQNGNTNHGSGGNLAGPVQASAANGNIEDCAYHVIRLVWNAANQIFDVYFDGVLRTSYSGDIVNNTFGGNPNVYWGFTAATGGATNEHRFCLNIVPSFNTSAPTVCAGSPMQFNDASTSNLGVITQWTWNFGDGTAAVSGSATPTHTYAVAGIYNVTLTVNDISGCGASQTFPVTVNPSPIVTVGADASVCPGTPIVLTVNPVDPSLQYNWTPAAGLTGANTSQASFTATVTTTYTLTVTDPNGCSGSDGFILTVYPEPVASFTTSNHCYQTPGSFISTSSVANGNIVNYAYQFGDGFGSAQQDPNYFYATPGTYQTQLQVQDNRGCVGTSAFVPVVVYDLPTPTFNFTDACLGTANTFTSTSGQAGTAAIVLTGWDFGDNIQVLGTPTTHTYAASGQYLATLVIQDQNTCQNGIQQQVNVYDLPEADFTVTNVCLGTQVCPIDLSTAPAPEVITAWDWSWGDGTANGNTQNACHTYATAGNYTVSLTITTANGCVNTITSPITIFENPTADFTFTNVCNGQQMDFTNTSTSNDGLIDLNNWTYGDGNADLNVVDGSNTYNNDGNYNVTLDIETVNGCVATVTQPVVIFPAPLIGFTFTNECENIAINFADNTNINPPAIITNYAWDFGDGNVGSGAAVAHTYSSDNTYTATLAVTTSDGCTATANNQVIVYPEPTAAFTVLPVCDGDPSLFTDASIGTITTRAWDFGGGNLSGQQNPTFTFTYTAPTTTYPTTLTVTSNFGCVNSVTDDAIVNPIPAATFTTSPATICLGEPVNFTGTNGSTVPITGWDYNFNNFQGLPLPSTHAYTQDASFTYSTSLTYNVRLTVTSDQGCTSFVVNPVLIDPIPYADFTFDYVCEGSPTNFVDASTIVIGTIDTYSWDFGDGGFGNTPSPQHQYVNAGTYNPTLTITSAANCTSTNTYPVIVNPNPVVTFTAPGVCEGTASNFINNSTIISGTIDSYSWDFGDNTAPDTNQVPAPHLYIAAGNYLVTLTAISDSGCTASTPITDSVYPNPVADFIFDVLSPDSCLPVGVDFRSTSTVATIANQTNTIDSYSYDFGDGNEGTSANPSNTYTTDGYFDVGLTVTTNHGCTNSVVQNQIILTYPVPVANFSQNTNIVDLFAPNIDFINLSTGETLYDWDFNDGSRNATIPNPTHTFTDTGYFDILLTVTNQYGCTDTTSHVVRVVPFYSLWIPNAFTVNEDKKNMIFNAVGEGVKEFEMRVFNRWGEEVFRTKSLDHGWDGVVEWNGIDAPQAVYAYWVRSKDFTDRRYLYQGHVTLIR